ncbi:MAG: long-chain fatty acid--CoA ligase [Xanthomonadales bacterium]|nr:long-chain fatty acid--CoA ligase [Xanthomonadales bacterium]
MSFLLFDFLAQRAELSPDRIAMEDLISGERVSYAGLDARAGRAASLLAENGVEAGDRVALLCRNRIEFFELLFACGKLGAILVPLNWRMPAAELEPLIADSRPTALIFGKEDEAVAQSLPSATRLALDGDYAQARDDQPVHAGRGPWRHDDTWYLLYTSGTTGKPKAVIQTCGMALANAVNIKQAMGLRGEDTTLNYLPLFHTAGINLVTLPALMDGARVLVLPGFDVDRVASLLAEGELDNFFGVPAVYQALSLHPDFQSWDLRSVRSWACGGAPLPDVLIHQYAPRGARVLNGMGMTETGPTVFLMDPDLAEEKIGAVGKPQLLSQVRLVDRDGNDVPRGQPGEMWFSGPGVTPGYWNNPEATEQAFVDGVWLRSGDLGRQDEDGYFYVVGRLKDMYISGGENVYPAEVENQLADHPAVLEAAVVGVSDARWGEVGCAYLMLRPEAEAPDEEDLVRFCRERLAAYKVPKYFVIVEDFPRTAAGKVQKHLLEPRDGE